MPLGPSRFFSAVYADNARRVERRRVPAKDALLYARGWMLRPVERALVRRHRDPARPVLFIVGAPRSGTTLLYQLLTRHLNVGYPTAGIARSWMTPVLATRRAVRGGRVGGTAELASSLGHVEGEAAPHEFGWFWHYWMGLEDSDHLDASQLAAVDGEGLAGELLGMAGAFGAPVVVKSVNATNYHLPWLREQLPTARFVWMRRDPRFTAQSILAARAQRYGDERVWWSVRPRDVAAWSERDPLEQVAHQVTDIEGALERSMGGLPEGLGTTVTYAGLAADPEGTVRRLGQLCGAVVRDPEALAAVALEARNEVRMEPARFAALERALAAATTIAAEEWGG